MTDLLVAEIDHSALAHNTRILKAAAGGGKLMAVVKANAYGHGAVEVAQTVLASGADELGVATLTEAQELIAAGISAPILCWIWSPEEDFMPALAAGVQLGVSSRAHLQAIIDSGAASILGAAPQVTAVVDTGLNRSGVRVTGPDWQEYVTELATAHQSGAVNVTGGFSHLACADDVENPANDAQADEFRAAIADLESAGLTGLTRHLSNSPATLTRPDLNFDMVRPGVAFYGMEPVPGQSFGLQPVLSLSAKILIVKKLKAGQSVSYSHTWTAPRDTTVAVVPFGYADGMPRALSGRFEVAIDGVRYPQVGRVCMDQFVIDLGPDSTVTPGQRAWLIGDGSHGEWTATQVAEAIDTIHYEVLTMLRGRVERRHKNRFANREFPAHGEVVLPTADDMREFGAWLGSALQAGDLVVLDGPLGAGKTTLTQGIAAGMQVQGRVTSPTFTIARVHHPEAGADAGAAAPSLVHVDAYRLFGEEGPDSGAEAATGATTGASAGASALDQLDALDLDTDLMDCVVVAEWGAGLVEQLSDNYLLVEIDRSAQDDSRRVAWRRN
ncbi:bifunctional alanine racemase/tRNA (adenosine(37)-N6)-threonylcarbamoyltransferase complex ATPase subunit type 1 TsaE [Corynebacterium ulceribovis]|uniref:bifunctional alanine racemase/tRNA (adenosine(37)-N6)-threonylcarbamoyltransferase complex ATPase subunit type 1 TsaE n=1 Tax=Corynebacterium ulceribovis TaxID=487732 RepID=UPI00035C2927|nr:bifunctional alanine racemase/tRNA (adenosine(37)-N6)-threonylcarbamoyltransferase complex ATPase subunit type 1 TsaE [Corynebacterium ulceribovis]